nr:MAG TPA: hypothetical protein [Caudoviricetes sp.]DAZ32820.1 MAG TPA: hypothetical protein [Caudoviricetes sp.]
MFADLIQLSKLQITNNKNYYSIADVFFLVFDNLLFL